MPSNSPVFQATMPKLLIFLEKGRSNFSGNADWLKRNKGMCHVHSMVRWRPHHHHFAFSCVFCFLLVMSISFNLIISLSLLVGTCWAECWDRWWMPMILFLDTYIGHHLAMILIGTGRSGDSRISHTWVRCWCQPTHDFMKYIWSLFILFNTPHGYGYEWS